MAEKKEMSEKEMEKKLKDLKIGLLKQNQKRKGLKKEIARTLTMKNKTKLTEDKTVNLKSSERKK